VGKAIKEMGNRKATEDDDIPGGLEAQKGTLDCNFLT
jgi:hypothetical protein